VSAPAPGGRVLVVDDEPVQRDILRLTLESEGHAVEVASGGRRALAALAAAEFDLVLTDLKMPDLGGVGLLERLARDQPGTCVILLTAHGSIDSAVQAMKLGAFDYLTKPLDRDVLLLAVDRALERSRLLRENRALQEQLRDRFRLEGMVGEHGAMQEVFRIVRKVAPASSTVLLCGESGTGKELVARALHAMSPQRDRPFHAVNLSALPETVLEAELFGHERGAFTGAISRRLGHFEQASGSTLFLDEIGELRRDLQVKLLRVLQEREIQRVGGTERIAVDVRVVAATNRDLARAVRAGEFREDLFYRLSVIPVRIPPLRERTSDIPLLVEHFAARHGDPQRPRRFSGRALEALMRHPWPGNVRELESVVERTLLLSEAATIEPADLPPLMLDEGGGLPGELELPPAGIDLEGLERHLIRKALDRTAGNVTRAARLLRLSRRTLQYRLEKMRGADAAADPGEPEADPVAKA